MSALSFHAARTIFPFLILAPALGCSTLLSDRTTGGTFDDGVISAEEIRTSGAATAWDALKRTLPSLAFTENRSGTPTRMVRRGQSSLYLDDAPGIFVDGVRIGDFRVLEQVPAQNIFSIRFLNGIDGTTYYGTNAGDGVIVIRTKRSPEL